MCQQESEHLLSLLRLIMSSKSKEEMQAGALRCLRSDPDVLCSLLRMLLHNENRTQTASDIDCYGRSLPIAIPRRRFSWNTFHSCGNQRGTHSTDTPRPGFVRYQSRISRSRRIIKQSARVLHVSHSRHSGEHRRTKRDRRTRSDNSLLIQRLMKIMVRPKPHQCPREVLTLLQSDDKIRKMFVTELSNAITRK